MKYCNVIDRKGLKALELEIRVLTCATCEGKLRKLSGFPTTWFSIYLLKNPLFPDTFVGERQQKVIGIGRALENGPANYFN